MRKIITARCQACRIRAYRVAYVPALTGKFAGGEKMRL